MKTTPNTRLQKARWFTHPAKYSTPTDLLKFEMPTDEATRGNNSKKLKLFFTVITYIAQELASMKWNDLVIGMFQKELQIHVYVAADVRTEQVAHTGTVKFWEEKWL